jgi:plastocyanin
VTRILRKFLVPMTLASLALFALSCGDDDGDNPMNPPGGGADVTINITGQNGSNSYAPSPDTVTVGQTVRWHNANGTAHTANGGGGINTGTVAAGNNSPAIQMNTAGSFPYACTIHPAMTGVLVVQP